MPYTNSSGDGINFVWQLELLSFLFPLMSGEGSWWAQLQLKPLELGAK